MTADPPRRSRSALVPVGACATFALVLAACSAAQAPSWTYDPAIGQATPGASVTSSGAPSSATPATASPTQPAGTDSGAHIDISAKNIAFDTASLTAPAGQPFTIDFDNQDPGVPHNIAIYTDSTATTDLFRGATITGPAQGTYSVPALQPGTYYFRCDIHPSLMFGTFVVQ